MCSLLSYCQQKHIHLRDKPAICFDISDLNFNTRTNARIFSRDFQIELRGWAEFASGWWGNEFCWRYFSFLLFWSEEKWFYWFKSYWKLNTTFCKYGTKTVQNKNGTGGKITAKHEAFTGLSNENCHLIGLINLCGR